MHNMKWRITPLALALITTAYAADEGVIQKSTLEFYIVPNATIVEMERSSANASAYAMPPAVPYVYKQARPARHYHAIRHKRKVVPPKVAPKPAMSKPAPIPAAPCLPIPPVKQPEQHVPTFLKVFPQ